MDRLQVQSLRSLSLSILTGTVFEKTRQAPSTIVLILRGIAKGEPTARLARELGVGRPRMHEIRKRVQTNLRQTLPSEPMSDEVLEADEQSLRSQRVHEPKRLWGSSSAGAGSSRVAPARVPPSPVRN